MRVYSQLKTSQHISRVTLVSKRLDTIRVKAKLDEHAAKHAAYKKTLQSTAKPATQESSVFSDGRNGSRTDASARKSRSLEAEMRPGSSTKGSTETKILKPVR